MSAQDDNPEEVCIKNSMEIIQMEITIDYFMKLFISRYYVASEKGPGFGYYVLDQLSFLQKMNIIDKICKDEHQDAKEMIKALDFIRTKRNKIAHRMPVYDPRTNRNFIDITKRMDGKIDKLELTEEFMKDIHKKENMIYDRLISIMSNFPALSIK